MYTLLRPLFFLLPPEVAHHVALSVLSTTRFLPAFRAETESKPINVMGIEFQNPVGLAAGLDKNADYIDGLSRLGFGFIEVGTVTPRAQAGNRKPRLFRLPEAEAIINRMGFNNKGVEHLIQKVKKNRQSCVLGINIGKNVDTPVEQAHEDYLFGMQRVYAYADYVTVNISSPNTPGLRSLQEGDRLESLLQTLKKEQAELCEQTQRYVPLVVKVAPDLDEEAIIEMSDTISRLKIDGVIATNTTFSRNGVYGVKHGSEKGGLSGKPLFIRSTNVLRRFRAELNPEVALIAAGGIFSTDDAKAKLDAGASLVQIYSALIYRGPGFARALVNDLAAVKTHS